MQQVRKIALAVVILLISFASAFANGNVYKVQNSESLFSIFSDKLSDAKIISLEKDIKKVLPEFTLKIGTVVKISPVSVMLSPNNLTDISISLVGNDAYNIKVTKHAVNTIASVVTGTVNSSLVEAVTSSGENPELAFMLADIYEWEIDFFHALRKGDSFTMLVEKKFAKDKFIGYGKILAADFINQGRLIRALYYDGGRTKGYFGPDGKSLKKGFLKAPLKYSRISSSYTGKRLHPVLNVYRPHYGVDFAAPTGTPIHATAAGTVVDRGYRIGNGNYIKLRHMNGYETMYMHLSKFNGKYKRGSSVAQGDVIGYVGMTGYATGPHLDYRIKHNGTFLNPVTFTSPNLRLPKSDRTAFLKSVKPYAALIDSAYGRSSRFAMTKGNQSLASPL